MGSRFDVDDELWEQIEPLIPVKARRRQYPGRLPLDNRQALNGILYVLHTGIAWRDLPGEFGPWQTVWKRHRRFAGDGTWDRVLSALLTRADAAEVIDWQVAVDSTIARAHQHATNTTRLTGGLVESQESARRA